MKSQKALTWAGKKAYSSPMEFKNIDVNKPEDFSHMQVAIEKGLVLPQEGDSFPNLFVRFQQSLERECPGTSYLPNRKLLVWLGQDMT